MKGRCSVRVEHAAPGLFLLTETASWGASLFGLWMLSLLTFASVTRVSFSLKLVCPKANSRSRVQELFFGTRCVVRSSCHDLCRDTEAAVQMCGTWGFRPNRACVNLLSASRQPMSRTRCWYITHAAGAPLPSTHFMLSLSPVDLLEQSETTAEWHAVVTRIKEIAKVCARF